VSELNDFNQAELCRFSAGMADCRCDARITLDLMKRIELWQDQRSY